VIEPWMVVAVVSLAFSIPVLLASYYTVILFVSSLRCPRSLGLAVLSAAEFPTVSILIASYNEKFVIGRTLDAINSLNYPKEKLQVVVADDSSDETVAIIDSKVEMLESDGITALVSRRETRENFKSGALNHAAPLLTGDYVLLLDSDSTVTPTVLSRGLAAFGLDSKIGFVSLRVGHYNRDQNVITRLFALQQDQGDTITKMGSYAINAPYSFQGGFTLMSMQVLRSVGFWTNDSIVDDADLSCKVYCSGWRGIYLSDVKVFSEDPSTLEVWKKQAARVAQGWAKCARSRWREILQSSELTYWRKFALLIFLLGPFSGISWIVVTFVSALALILGYTAPVDSIFTNGIYISIVTLPVIFFFASGGYALFVQKIMTPKNLVLLPLLSYTSSCMVTAISIGFLNGIRGRPGFFFRTPKRGIENRPENRHYFGELRFEKTTFAEGLLSTTALGLSILIALQGVWFLAFSLAGFGVLTLKSMNLSRILRSRKQNTCFKVRLSSANAEKDSAQS